MIDRYQLLNKYQDQSIKITGIFQHYSIVAKQFRDINTALLQDVYAHIDGKDLDVGHVWLQNVDRMKTLGLSLGDRIQCSCRVTTYKKRLMTPNKDGLMIENGISLGWPSEVVVINRIDSANILPIPIPSMKLNVQVERTTPMAVELTANEVIEPFSPAKLIREVRLLAKFGRWV